MDVCVGSVGVGAVENRSLQRRQQTRLAETLLFLAMSPYSNSAYIRMAVLALVPQLLWVTP
jgi:hypothetical protein